jgi:hypothetical protein
VKPDELIDDIARRMTAGSERPALRDRVMARMEVEASPIRWALIAPAAAGAAVVFMVWLAGMPPAGSSPRDVSPVPPQVVTESPSGRGSSHMPGATSLEATNARPLRAATGTTEAADVARSDLVEERSTDAPGRIPVLPALTRPAPIVIAGVASTAVTMPPLAVQPVKTSRLAIEPLNLAGILPPAPAEGL